MATESQKSISDWAEATFGETGSLFRAATRANEEMAELLSAIAKGEMERAPGELADVVIVLTRISERLGADPKYFPAGQDLGPSIVGAPEFSAALLNQEVSELIADIAEEKSSPHLCRSSVCRAFSTAGYLARLLGIDLQAEVDRKMAINRARTWRKDGTGHGYHVKCEAKGKV